MSRGFVVAVSGLAIETRIARGAGVRAIIAGSATCLAEKLSAEIRDGAAALISFGIAGGLADSVRTGTCVVGRRVIDGGATYAADPAWSAALAERIARARIADIVGNDVIVSESSVKRALHARTRAFAVDTESHVVARAAHAHGLPFAVLRVVSDAANRGLPAAANVGIGRGGRIAPRAVLGSVARSPAQIAALARTAIDAAVALRALSRARRRLGAGLAYPDLGEFLLDVV